MKEEKTIREVVVSEMINILQKYKYSIVFELFYDVKVDNGEYEKHLRNSPYVCEDESVSFDTRVEMSLDRFRNSCGYNLFGEGMSLVHMSKTITINNISFDYIRDIMKFPINDCKGCEFIRFVYDDLPRIV